MHFISRVFDFVALLLYRMAKATGMSYKAVNILVYYYAIPLSWLVLIDIALDVYYCTVAGVLLIGLSFVWLRDFEKFSQVLFDRSELFLRWFKRLGTNYVAASVLICVALPLLIYALLIFYAFFR